MTKPYTTTVCLIAFTPAFWSIAPAARAQQAAQPEGDQKPVATLHVQAREVLLPVTVRDKHGALVSSLNMADFALTEDGRPQVIKSFTRETKLSFRLGLLVDTSRSLSAGLESERKAADKFVDQMLPAEPKAALVAMSPTLLRIRSVASPTTSPSRQCRHEIMCWPLTATGALGAGRELARVG